MPSPAHGEVALLPLSVWASSLRFRRSLKIEHEYRRLGSWAYLAAWDVHQAKIYGRCESRCTIVTFDRLVQQVMSQDPYRQAHRVFWIVDNGTCHRGVEQRLIGVVDPGVQPEAGPCADR